MIMSLSVCSVFFFGVRSEVYRRVVMVLSLKFPPLFRGVQRRRRRRKVHAPVARQLYKEHREEAVVLLRERVHHFSAQCGYTAARVTIKDQSRRWGSCSASGNLNLNYRLAYLPPCARDYVIVHELCHLVELNHSPAFWSLVEQHFPNMKRAQKLLREIEKATNLDVIKIKRYQDTCQHQCEYCLQMSESFTPAARI